MNNTPRTTRTTLLIAILITALLGTMTVVVASNIASPKTAALLCDVQSLRTFAAKGEASDKLAATVILQEAEVCELEGNPEDAALKASLEAQAKKAAEEKAAKDAADAKKAATDKAADDKAKADPNNPDNWTRYERELISTRPTAEKMSLNSFGPKHALHPDFRGTQLDALSAKQFVDELKYRMPMSPVLTAGTGASLDFWPESQVNDKIALFLGNKDEWKKAVDQISTRLDEELKKGAKVVSVNAGNYSATYAVVDSDGVPHFAVDDNVNRPESFKVFRLADGTILRIICGGQQYNQHKAPTKMPKPSKGMGRDNEGNPVVLVDACRKVNGVWKNVFNVKPKTGDRKVNSSKCEPKKTPPKTTPPPKTPPPTTPPKSCPPGTFWSSTYKKCLKNKKNETPPPAPTNRPLPTSAPTRSPENTPPPTPTEPATTTPPVIPAPESTPTPTTSVPIPTTEPSATATGDDDPDN